ncbi:hypothetical protein RHGRI_006320 [Rhododendron griersonianum]|uniref:AAA+ ATPase domain-containing protein n=1 Tax=Rhododendron griersonianum TaxID=479676 RepID=A0AAV6KTP7_9ERIC|nr:hypothetical protein RHGRI_006320 [Rhododendron griersonianum]
MGDLGFEEAIKAWKYVRHYTENLQKLQVKLRDLGDCTATITREVSEAIGRGDEIEVNVPHWRTDADSLKNDIEQLIGESTTKASISCIACSCPNIVWRYKFSKQAEEKIADADALIGKYNNFNHQISHPRSHYMENFQKLKDKLRDLNDCRETITTEVSEANGRGDEIEVNVSHWRTDADSLKDDIEQLIRESTNICSTECPCPDIMWQYEFSKQAKEKIANADELITKYYKFNHQISHPRPCPPELESLSDKNYVSFDSRASIFKDIMDALKDSNVNMIGVFGLGGVGKTTLVKEVAEQMRKDGTFKQVAMAVVSKDLNVKEVQSKLADSLNFEFKAKVDNQKRRATELWNKFTNGDKYLIILDDIWEGVKMEEIGIPCTNEEKGCKVLLTSRNEDLLSTIMEVDRNLSIAILSSTEAWTLFMKKVGNSIQSQLEIQSLAYKVCERCKGLPVAINALGEALKGKQEHAWKIALDKLDKCMLTKIEGINPSVLASLRVSFDKLPSPDAKSCFLLCCLFAKDAEIPIDELMRLCVARNLLDQNPHTLDEATNAVRTVVNTLKSASLLTTGSHETVVKIHDVIRDVGISIAREEEAFLVYHGALRWPRNPTNEPSYKAMSLSFKNIKGLPDGLVYPRIHTLMVDNTNFSDLEVGDNFFNGMTQLVVLTVTRMCMQPLPSSLAKLTNLKMLYLNKCKLADIAILKDLKSNLEVLSLRDSSIKVLPPEIGQLTSLRVLDLQDCDELMVIPRGVISNLTGLEELYFPMTFDQWGATTDEQQDTGHTSLEELDTSNRSDNASLEELDTSSIDNASLEELRESLANAQLTTLYIHIPNVKLLPKEDLKFANLKRFRISVGSKFNFFEAFFSQTCLLKLEGIQLRNEFIPLVDKAEVLILKPESSVHPLQLFNKLTVLIIEHFKLKYLFSPTTARGLIHLEVLEVTSCEIMEGIVGFEGQKDENEITSEVKFSKLRQLTLTSLPNLISFFAKKEEMGTTMGSFSARAQPLFNEQVIFPVLEWLKIDGLGNIIKIWDKQSIAVLEEQGSFSQLTNLVVSSCSKLMHVFPSNMHPLLKNLKGLNVEECETMKGIAEFEGEIDEDGLRNEVAASPALEVEHFEMVGVPKITEIRDKQPLLEPKKEVESLCKLMYISIEKCGQLLYVFPSHMLPQNLQQLIIKECDELEVIFSKELKDKEAINNDIIVFPRLEAVTLKTLHKLKSFYTNTQGVFFSHKVIFPVLKQLSIRKVHKLIEIWAKQSIAIFEEQGSFCQLTDLDVSECEKLMHVFPSKMHSPLINLEVLRVSYCPTMKGIVEFEEEIDEDGLRNEGCFSKLSHLRLYKLPNLESFCTKLGKADTTEGNSIIHALPLFNGKVAFPVLEWLSLEKLDKITRIWDDQPLAEPEKEAKSFSKLEVIFVVGCDQLEYVLPSYMLPQLKNLQELNIDSCTKVEVIISNNPKEKEVTNNNDTIQFPQLKTLKLWSLPNLKSFVCSDEMQSIFSDKVQIKVVLPVLEIMWFHNLDKITRIWDDQPLSEPEKEAKSFSELEGIMVDGCDQLEYVLPSYMLPQLKNLQELKIKGCTKVEVIISNNPKEKEVTNNNDTIRFPQLNTLKLWSLPNLKSFICSDEMQSIFSNKVAFPVLEKLSFRNLDKITRIWNYQPLSEPGKEAKSFSELKYIIVDGCDQFEYVLPFYMLPQLKNLQELSIKSCTKVEVIISNNPKEKEATNNNDTIRFPRLEEVTLRDLPNLKSFICCDETQLFFSNKDAFPVLEDIELGKDLKFLRNETSTKEVSIEEWSTSNEESDYNDEEFDEDLETPTKEECSTSGKENDHNGAELDEDLATPTKKVSMEFALEITGAFGLLGRRARARWSSLLHPSAKLLVPFNKLKTRMMMMLSLFGL